MPARSARAMRHSAIAAEDRADYWRPWAQLAGRVTGKFREQIRRTPAAGARMHLEVARVADRSLAALDEGSTPGEGDAADDLPIVSHDADARRVALETIERKEI